MSLYNLFIISIGTVRKLIFHYRDEGFEINHKPVLHNRIKAMHFPGYPLFGDEHSVVLVHGKLNSYFNILLNG